MQPRIPFFRAGLGTIVLTALLAACGGGGGGSDTGSDTDNGGSSPTPAPTPTPTPTPSSYRLSLDVAGLPDGGQLSYTHNGVTQTLNANGSSQTLQVYAGDTLALGQTGFGDKPTALFHCALQGTDLGSPDGNGTLTLASGLDGASQPIRCDTVKLAAQPLEAVTYGVNHAPYHCLSASLVSAIPCGFGVLRIDPLTAQGTWLKYLPDADPATPIPLGASQGFGNFSTDFTQPAAILNGELYFSAHAENTKTELWATDGTESGTRLVKDIRLNHRTQGSNPTAFASIGDGKLYFRADDGAVLLYETDGTAAGTKRTPITGQQGATGYGLTAVGNKLFFYGTVSSRQAYDLLVLKRVDGEQQVSALAKGEDGYLPDAEFLAVVTRNGKPAVLSAWHETPYVQDTTAASAKRLHVVDVEQETVNTVTSKVAYFAQYSWMNGAQHAVGADGFLYFIGHTAETGYQLWKTDGTDANTIALTAFPASNDAGKAPMHITATSAQVYFTAYDATHGREVWVTDGTAQGTKLVADIYPGAERGTLGTNGLYAGEPTRLVAAGNRIVFQASSTGQTPQELWVAENGNAVRLADGADTLTDKTGNPRHTASLNGALLYTKRLNADAPYQNEFWVTDGTAAGTRLVRDTDGQPVTTTSAN